MKIIDGYKTYIGLVGLGVTGFCVHMGWIDSTTANILYGVFGAWSGVGVGHKAIKRAKGS